MHHIAKLRIFLIGCNDRVTIQIKLHVPSGTVVLNRPNKQNALDRALIRSLQQAFEDLHQERRVRAVILTGSGDTFCAGLDLTEMLATCQEEFPHEQWHQDVVALKELFETMLRFPKPIIVAANGSVLGAGVGLILAADYVVGSTNCQIGLPEPSLGLVSGLVAPLLWFRAGGGTASRLLLSAMSMDATAAQTAGLLHDVVAPEQTWARAQEVAERCAQSAPESLQLTKRLLNETIGEQLFSWLSAGAAASATARTTEAAVEGLAAFAEGRLPEWQ